MWFTTNSKSPRKNCSGKSVGNDDTFANFIQPKTRKMATPHPTKQPASHARAGVITVHHLISRKSLSFSSSAVAPPMFIKILQFIRKSRAHLLRSGEIEKMHGIVWTGLLGSPFAIRLRPTPFYLYILYDIEHWNRNTKKYNFYFGSFFLFLFCRIHRRLLHPSTDIRFA